MHDQSRIQAFAALATIAGTLLNIFTFVVRIPQYYGVFLIFLSIVLIALGVFIFSRYQYFGSPPIQVAGGEWNINFEQKEHDANIKPIAKLVRTRELKIKKNAPPSIDATFGIEDDTREFHDIQDTISPNVSIKKKDGDSYTSVNCSISPDRFKYVTSTIVLPDWVHQNGGQFTLKEEVTLLNSFDSENESYTISIVRPFNMLSVNINFGVFKTRTARVRIKRGSIYPASSTLPVKNNDKNQCFIEYDIKRPRVGDHYIFEWEWEVK